MKQKIEIFLIFGLFDPDLPESVQHIYIHIYSIQHIFQVPFTFEPFVINRSRQNQTDIDKVRQIDGKETAGSKQVIKFYCFCFQK